MQADSTYLFAMSYSILSEREGNDHGFSAESARRAASPREGMLMYIISTMMVVIVYSMQ